jgi:hypothetical protein
LQNKVFVTYGETAVYIPGLLLSAAAELRGCLNDEGRAVRLPCWGNVSETDNRYLTHQWAKKTDIKLIPVVAAPPARHVVRIPARRKVVEAPSTTPPKAGSSKRAATASPSPNRKGIKRARAASRPAVIMPTPRKRSKSKAVAPDSGSEKGSKEPELEKEKGKEKGKGKGKGKSAEVPAKVSASLVHITHRH